MYQELLQSFESVKFVPVFVLITLLDSYTSNPGARGRCGVAQSASEKNPFVFFYCERTLHSSDLGGVRTLLWPLWSWKPNLL